MLVLNSLLLEVKLTKSFQFKSGNLSEKGQERRMQIWQFLVLVTCTRAIEVLFVFVQILL